MDRVQIAALVAAAGLFGLALLPGFGPEPPAPQGPPESIADSGAVEPLPERTGAPVERDASPLEPLEPDGTTPGEAAGEIAETPRREIPYEVRPLANDVLRLEVGNGPHLIESIELPAFGRAVQDPSPVELVTAEDRGTLDVSFGPDGALGALSARRLEVVSQDRRSIVQRGEVGGVEVMRTLRLDPEGYGGELRLRLVNRGSEPVQPRFEVGLTGRERPTGAPDHFQNAALVVSVSGDLERAPLARLEVPGMFSGPSPLREEYPFGVVWVGVESQYFLSAVLADSARDHAGVSQSIGPQTGRSSILYPARAGASVPPGQQLEKVYELYFGPKLEDPALAVDPRLEPALRVGWAWVRPLVLLFAGALSWIYTNVVANYGVAIILITVLLRLGTFPLTQRSMKSMKRLSTFAPQMRELQEKYRDDSERLQQEMMALYRRGGVNPVTAMAGGCLPMLLQMPFMVALYFALQGSIELRHADFLLWIDDLSAPENLASVLGLPIRPLPLLMGGSMILQQWLTPQTGDEQQAQQRKMMMLMSGVFTIMFYQFPSGLVLYWLISNLLGIGQQLLVNRAPETA